MATAPGQMPIEQYMHTSYSPDCEYIDGVIVERNVGQGKHSFTQGEVFTRLDELLAEKNLLVLLSLRTRVSRTQCESRMSQLSPRWKK